ncbi:hypothetical protein MATL_G00187540 [Megalops atlanticus]|uniref:Uncharacterized protein n=1 Tax=Megalops atlanticus TaxID=7932 RepID=A0A9D3PKW8_MEGAT|nr:hypothetical protein MATL_G00187540 [Megalops atlanticus]
MGNENSSGEPPKLFILARATAHTDSQTGEKRDSTTENGSVLTDPPAAQPEQHTPQTSEEEERRRREEEEKEELLFPHDLLPSTDLSTELNIWETSLGSTQVGTRDMKSEQVTLSSSTNPLLAGLQHYTEASPSVAGVVKRYRRQ